MIPVIKHVSDRTRYDEKGKIIETKGVEFVSHGINTETGRTVILPQEKWQNFRHNCVLYENEWYLK
jgi:hypothetical protein